MSSRERNAGTTDMGKKSNITKESTNMRTANKSNPTLHTQKQKDQHLDPFNKPLRDQQKGKSDK